MKILHIADTHLGFSAYGKAAENGINQREIDVYDAFQNFVDYAVQSKPDLIIHAGDLFDSVRPNNRAITFSIKQILRLSELGIPFILIAGNHEHPKLKETGHIFSIFDHFKNVYPIYKAKYETVSFNKNEKKITIHAIPHSPLKKEFNDNFKKLEKDPSSDYNILVTHGCVKGIKEFSMNEFNELIIPRQFLKSYFDYTALGHYHNNVEVSKNVLYAGSTECFTFTDAGSKKGFIEIDLIDKAIRHKFISLKNRPMIDTNPIVCSDLKINEVMKKIKDTINEIVPKDKVFRIILEDIPPHIYRGIDLNEIRKLSSRAVHFEIKADIIKQGGSEITGTTKIDALTHEFKFFLENQDIKEKEEILNLGMKYIEKIETMEEKK